ncbi:hypothetical protein [Pseudomonas sp. GV071]|uniref:hypothetical protein n=1 Tax=Pseudomonas sp. GV071 TaxID=2135754 RepID=UPI0015B47A63|nr:hypothetical protein [Pseudomonas sp. GV071]
MQYSIYAPSLRRFSIVALVTCPLLANADNARDWQNTPIDTNFVFGYWNLVNSNTPIDSSFPLDGLSVDANVGAHHRWQELQGAPGRLQPIALPDRPTA